MFSVFLLFLPVSWRKCSRLNTRYNENNEEGINCCLVKPAGLRPALGFQWLVYDRMINKGRLLRKNLHPAPKPVVDWQDVGITRPESFREVIPSTWLF